MQGAARVTVRPRNRLSLVVKPNQSMYFDSVNWDQYVAISDALPDRSNLRITYDSGRLELMSIGDFHELLKYLLGRLIDVLIDEFELDGNGYGQMTHRRKDLAKALESDACYYLKSWKKVRGRKRIDLSRDPPPDLALEIDISRSSLPRMPIYESIGVPELWRFQNEAVTVYLLDRYGKYKEADRSPTFPLIRPSELADFVRMGISEGGRAMVKAFRQSVREQIEEERG